jgi:hypothetical protein
VFDYELELAARVLKIDVGGRNPARRALYEALPSLLEGRRA